MNLILTVCMMRLLQTDIMYSKSELFSHFEEFPNIIENTKAILNTCNIDFGFDLGSAFRGDGRG